MRRSDEEPAPEPQGLDIGLATRAQQIQFGEYQARHNKNYQAQDEYEMRMALWLEADRYIRDFDIRSTTVRLGHNKFSDMTDEEMHRPLGRVRGRPAPANELISMDDANPGAEEETEICNPRYNDCQCPLG